MKIPVVREAFIKKSRIQIGFASFDFNFDLFLNFFLFLTRLHHLVIWILDNGYDYVNSLE